MNMLTDFHEEMQLTAESNLDDVNDELEKVEDLE